MSKINWNDTYTKTSPKLLGICRRYIKDTATAEDIIQDSFMVAMQKQDDLKDVNALHGWLSRIVVNMALHHLKNEKKIAFNTTDDYDVVDSTSLTNNLEMDNKGLILASDLGRDEILEAIDALPDHHKTVFNMYVIDQFSHNEIGKALNISTGTSKSHLSRARKSVQLFLLEKIKGKPVDEKKRRRIAFWLFFGFGDRMFANFYRKPFHDFEIQTQKKFPITFVSNSKPTHFIGLNKKNNRPRKTAFIFIAIIALLIFWLTFFRTKPAEKKIIQDNVEVQNSEEKSLIEPIITQELNTEVNKKDTLKQKKTTVMTPVKNSTTKPVIAKELFPEKPIEKVAEKEVEKIIEPVVEVNKDSVKKAPRKVVVIKRQIIKKDTVYVPK